METNFTIPRLAWSRWKQLSDNESANTVTDKGIHDHVETRLAKARGDKEE